MVSARLPDASSPSAWGSCTGMAEVHREGGVHHEEDDDEEHHVDERCQRERCPRAQRAAVVLLIHRPFLAAITS